jgi:muramoyltetrapeptide carboxypeptidase
MQANAPSMPPLRAKALRTGASLRLISPSSWFDPAKVQAGMEALRALGFQAQLAHNALAHYGQYSAGTPQQRIEDLHAAFADTTVDAVLCTRGGYGAAELLSGLDVAQIQKHPKALIGCSDATTLLTWLHDATGLITFHGPMAAGDFARPNGVDLPSWRAALHQTAPWSLGAQDGLRVLQQGKTFSRARGKFYGGCLSMLAASLGTPYEIRTEDTILFLEDVSTRPYQIDRMLMQLRLAGKLRSVRGIVFGPMRDCGQPGQPEDFLEQVLLRVLADFPGPIALGLHSGHVAERNITLPIGVASELDLSQPDAPALHFLEAAVSL